jgi:DNA processing protein
MACTACQRRSSLVASLAPAITSLSPSRERLLGLLSLPNGQLLYATKVKKRGELFRQLQLPTPTAGVPTAICRHDPPYPLALAQLPSAPAVLYATCTPARLAELLAAPTVAILGGRKYTPHARETTFELARDLAAAGVTVCSGVNEGLERIVQYGALEGRGNNIAAMASAPDLPNRPWLAFLQKLILAKGAAVSELPPGFSAPRGCAWPFVANQRIIAALANIVVVVEAGGPSCVFLTAQIAADLGADVAVVPGRITDPRGQRMFELLRDGAHPVACAADVLELIGEEGALAAAA